MSMTFIRLNYSYFCIFNQREHAKLELTEHIVDLPVALEGVNSCFAILCVDVHLAELAISIL